jgi:uncharacterized phiE125 gp8 family phage protein
MLMTLVQTTPPALEPISLAEAKLHLRLDTTAEDLLVAAQIMAARQHLEASLQVALLQQSHALFLDAWPKDGAAIALPLTPVTQIVAIRTYAPDGTPLTHSLAHFELARGTPPRVARTVGYDASTPLRRLNGIEIEFTSGFGASPADVPQPLRQALLHLVAHLFENRGTQSEDMPLSRVESLIAPWRRPRVL